MILYAVLVLRLRIALLHDSSLSRLEGIIRQVKHKICLCSEDQMLRCIAERQAGFFT